MAKTGRYTGERIKPAKLQAIINALGSGQTIEHITRTLHCGTETALGIRERESEDIEKRKQLIRASAARLAANGFDKLNREMDAGKINGALLVPVTGMATDKVIALSSDPSPQQNLHLYLQPRDVTGEFNSLLHSLQEKVRALRLLNLLPRSQTRGQTPGSLRISRQERKGAFRIARTVFSGAAWLTRVLWQEKPVQKER